MWASDYPARYQPRAAELLPRLPALERLLSPVRQVPRDRFEQPLRRDRDLVDRTLERPLVLAGRLPEAAHLAHELARGGSDLLIGSDDVCLTQGLDASTHATTIAGPWRAQRSRCGGSSGRSDGA